MARPPRHRLLERQLKRARTPSGELDLERLLELVSAAYDEQDLARREHERATELVSSEMRALNAQLRTESEARSRAATRVQALLDNASEAILAIDQDARLITFNKAAQRLFGYTAEEVLGRHVSHLLHRWEDDLKRVQAYESACALGSDSGYEFETVGRRSSGELFDAEVSLSRLDFDGETIITGFWRDISARKADEAAIIAGRDAAEAANRAKSEFLATMSHEIRTPMNGVLGMAAALAGTALDDNQRRMLQVVIDSGQGLMTLLSDILDLSKIEAGRMSFETAPFDLPGSVQAVAQLFAETAGAKGLDMRVEIAPAAQGWFSGDPTRFRQVVQNLVSNAVKFTSAGGFRIGVDAEPLADGRREIRVEVEDSGVGVPPEAASRLFEKFSQADATTTRQFGGTGLGLAICRQLIEAQGGRIGFHAAPSGGSLFWFTLPLAPAQAVASAPAEPTSTPEEARPLRILAAEDHPTNRFVLSALCAGQPIDLTFAEDGLSALEAARTHDFDLILMDVHMPVMDGLTATRAIRSLGGRRGAVPIVALTADAMPEHVAVCRAAGMNAHLSKPVKATALFAMISEMVESGSAPAAMAV